MKYLISALIILIYANSFAQNANTFFPSTTGYKWYYKNIPLDSNNNPNPSLATYRVDSFAVNANYHNLMASIVLTKSNLISIGQNTPYTDTNALNFQTTNGWSYVRLVNLDTLPIGGLLNFLKGLEAWYNVFRFAQTVNTEYTVFTKDTTIAIDTITLPLRFSLKGKRFNDENVTTVNGTYLSKKFLLTVQVSVVPLPIIVIPVLTIPDTTWIAPNIWMVKEVTPSSRLNLTNFGLPVDFSVPGSITQLTLPVGIKNISSNVPDDFKLYQNYPNPFNPNTVIRFDVNKASNIKLIIYDALGKEVTSMEFGKIGVGSYEVPFNADNIASGVYFYAMYSDNIKIDVKKLSVTK